MYFRLDTVLPPFIPLPHFIIAGEYSVNAKLLYGLLLGRTQLSQHEGWVSEEGNVFIIYSVRQMAKALNRNERTIRSALLELEQAGLLARVRQGLTKANRLYLLLPDGAQLSVGLSGKNCTHDGQKTSGHDRRKSAGQERQNLPPNNKERVKRKSQKKSDTSLCLGEFANVFLLETEKAAIDADFPGRGEAYIDRLSRYMASSGRHYANHYAALRKWLEEDTRGRASTRGNYSDCDEGECL